MGKKRHLTEDAIVTINGESLLGAGQNLVIADTQAAITAANIDLSAAEFFYKTITANTTFTLSNIPASPRAALFFVVLTNGGAFTLTWWAGIKWAGGSAPTLTASGKDMLGFTQVDGVWLGVVIGKDFK